MSRLFNLGKMEVAYGYVEEKMLPYLRIEVEDGGVQHKVPPWYARGRSSYATIHVPLMYLTK